MKKKNNMESNQVDLSENLEFDSIKHSYFGITVDEEINGLYIIQNLVDKEFLKNSFICTNELELYIMNLENFILQLKNKDVNNHSILYNFISHSITVYFIKLLEKMNFICIKKLEKEEENLAMEDVCLFFLNEKIKSVPAYFVSFELTDIKIDASALINLNRSLGISDETFIYNEELGIFEYNRQYQKEKISKNTFHTFEREKGIIRNFDKNITIWSLPFQIVKKELNYLVGYALYEAAETTTKVLEKTWCKNIVD